MWLRDVIERLRPGPRQSESNRSELALAHEHRARNRELVDATLTRVRSDAAQAEKRVAAHR
jgi:hypothetical protein